MNKDRADAARAEIIDTVSRVTAPEKMSKEEALDFLEEIEAEIGDRCDVLREEIKKEQT